MSPRPLSPAWAYVHDLLEQFPNTPSLTLAKKVMTDNLDSNQHVFGVLFPICHGVQYHIPLFVFGPPGCDFVRCSLL